MRRKPALRRYTCTPCWRAACEAHARRAASSARPPAHAVVLWLRWTARLLPTVDSSHASMCMRCVCLFACLFSASRLRPVRCSCARTSALCEADRPVMDWSRERACARWQQLQPGTRPRARACVRACVRACWCPSTEKQPFDVLGSRSSTRLGVSPSSKSPSHRCCETAPPRLPQATRMRSTTGTGNSVCCVLS
jgi:hypothetical protein